MLNQKMALNVRLDVCNLIDMVELLTDCVECNELNRMRIQKTTILALHHFSVYK